MPTPITFTVKTPNAAKLADALLDWADPPGKTVTFSHRTRNEYEFTLESTCEPSLEKENRALRAALRELLQ
jgi:hypothetical protein